MDDRLTAAYPGNLLNREVDQKAIQIKKGRRICTLSLYPRPPKHTTNLEDLYKCTKQRYKLLQILDEVYNCETSTNKEWLFSFVNKLTCEPDLLEFYKIILNDWEEGQYEHLIEWDTLSHFLLRVISSRLYESLKWFIKQEVKLLYIRWYLLNDKQRRHFLLKSNIILTEVSSEERVELYRMFMDQNLMNDLYKTRFMEASQLFKMRRVYLQKGWVYFKFEQAIFPIATQYSRYLNDSCRSAKKRYNDLVFDERFSYFFHRISEEIKLRFFKFGFSNSGEVRISDLNNLSSNSFPLCMEILHHYLLKENHLTNGGRLQYNLFLKGIGLSLQDAIIFWRNIFTKKITTEMFIREYLYSIRHNYGKLGKQANYPPQSCAKILDATCGPRDHHGCPFNITQKVDLNLHLQRIQISEEGIEEIWNLVKQNVPQQACAKLFEIRHGVTKKHPTTHPNIYFNNSRELIQRQELSSTSCSEQTCNSHCKQKQLEW